MLMRNSRNKLFFFLLLKSLFCSNPETTNGETQSTQVLICDKAIDDKDDEFLKHLCTAESNSSTDENGLDTETISFFIHIKLKKEDCLETHLREVLSFFNEKVQTMSYLPQEKNIYPFLSINQSLICSADSIFEVLRKSLISTYFPSKKEFFNKGAENLNEFVQKVSTSYESLREDKDLDRIWVIHLSDSSSKARIIETQHRFYSQCFQNIIKEHQMGFANLTEFKSRDLSKKVKIEYILNYLLYNFYFLDVFADKIKRTENYNCNEILNMNEDSFFEWILDHLEYFNANMELKSQEICDNNEEKSEEVEAQILNRQKQNILKG